jgi:hypothetical protein
MKETRSVFDATGPVAVQLRGPDGVKTVRVRFPSDDEWAERQRRRKVVVKQLERGISETTIQNGEEIDATLLAKVRTEADAPEVDAFEAQGDRAGDRVHGWVSVEPTGKKGIRA